MGLFDGISDFLFGSPPSTQTISPASKIAPADKTENSLYKGLGDINQKNIDYVNYLTGGRKGLYDATMKNMTDWTNNLHNLEYTGQLNPQMADQLMQMYENQIGNIDNYANTGVGSTLNQMANRGIINSSATGKALGDIANQANNQKNDAYSNYMNNYMNAYGNQYNADYNKLITEGTGLMRPYGLLDQAYSNAYSNPANMWNKIRTDRYGNTQDVVQTPSSNGLLQPLAGGIGTAIGSLFSDKNLKENITKVKEPDGSDCMIDGHQIYDWDWNEKGQELTDQKHGRGVIAQEVQETRPDAIITDDPSGFLMVDYHKLFSEQE